MLIIYSCSFVKTYDLNNGICRPKKPHFRLLKIPFVETDRLSFNKVYEGNTTSLGYSFYSDGRLICFNSDDGLALRDNNILGKNWNNAIAIGYWRVVEGNKIKIEYFVCQDGGFYTLKQGKVNKDSIIFYKNIYHPTRKEVREEKYILSKKFNF